VSSLSSYTAASSEVSKLTISFLSSTFGKLHRTCARTSGPILAAQPELAVICVSL